VSVTLVLGGARSGKSQFAEQRILKSGLSPVYIATGQAWDDEMTERVALHKARRGRQWETVEEPFALAQVLESQCRPDRHVLVDCLTLWLTNLMVAERDVAGETEQLVAGLGALTGDVTFVSNEVGLGIVPDNAMARAFRDHAGRLHQAIAAQADTVFFIAAGLPMTLKG
jgi:adenosylcobinamide kinase/adenosylcobinamide-phosphate guanylyltransferase